MNTTKKIAVCDDHALFRKGLASLIDHFPGYQVSLQAGNGKELLQLLNPTALPDIVLLDISMPEMDGYETAARLRETFPQVKTLALSTMDNEASIIRMIKSGAKGYVLKDAEPEELQRAFDDVLSIGYFFNEQTSRKVLQSIVEITSDSPSHV